VVGAGFADELESDGQAVDGPRGHAQCGESGDRPRRGVRQQRVADVDGGAFDVDGADIDLRGDDRNGGQGEDVPVVEQCAYGGGGGATGFEGALVVGLGDPLCGAQTREYLVAVQLGFVLESSRVDGGDLPPLQDRVE